MHKKVLLFDFFGVFCSSMSSTWFKKAVPNDTAKFAAFQALCNQSDLGKLPRADFYQAVAKLADVTADEVADGIEAEIRINEPLVEYVQSLKTGDYLIACLSNGSHEWTRRIAVKHGIGELFDEMLLSSDIGIVKPDAGIYRWALEKLQTAPERAMFIDDRQTNVDGAEACGIHSLLFTDTDAFIKEFEALNASLTV